MKQLVLSFILVWLSACAYSPQQITIKPQVDTEGEHYGNGRTLTVSTKDARENKVLGTRGGVYEETSTITIANDMTEAITRATQAKLATQGFNVNSEQADGSLTVVLEELTYNVPEGGLGKTVSLQCVLRVRAESGNEHFTGRYRTGSEQEFMFTPSMSHNERMVNQLLADTLGRAFADPKLKAFLSNI